MPYCCVLAIDTTSMNGSAALFRGGVLLAERRWAAEESHSTRLLLEIEQLLTALEGDWSQITHLAAICGPGSFTGIRIGLGTLQGLSHAVGKPILSLNALEALAFASPQGEGPLCAVIDARRQQVYHQRFEFGRGRMPMAQGPPMCQEVEHWIAGLGSSAVRCVGSGALLHRERIEALPGGHRVLPEIEWLAGYAVEIAALRISEGSDCGGPGVDALYIRPPDIRAPGSGLPGSS